LLLDSKANSPQKKLLAGGRGRVVDEMARSYLPGVNKSRLIGHFNKKYRGERGKNNNFRFWGIPCMRF